MTFSAVADWDPRTNLSAPLGWTSPRTISVTPELFGQNHEFIAAVFALMGATPQHQYVVRPTSPTRVVEWFERVQYLHCYMSRKNQLWHYLRSVVDTGDEPWRSVYRKAPELDWPLPNVAIGVKIRWGRAR